MFSPVGKVCLLCRKSAGCRRSRLLTPSLFEIYPIAARNITVRVSPYKIQHNDQELICQNCWRREAYPLRNPRTAVSSDYSVQEIQHPIDGQPEEPFTGQNTEHPAHQLADQPVEQPAHQLANRHTEEQSTDRADHPMEQPADQYALHIQPADERIERHVDPLFPPSSGHVCLICERSVLLTRRRTLTLQLFQEYPNAAKNITEHVSPYEVQFNNQEFICQNCWRREAYSLRNRRTTASADYSDQEIPYPISSQPEESYTGQDTEQPADQHAHHHTEEQLTGQLAEQPVEQPTHLLADQPVEQPAHQLANYYTVEQLTDRADHPMKQPSDPHAYHRLVEQLTDPSADHPMEQPADQYAFHIQPADERIERHVDRLFPPSSGHVCLICERSVLLIRKRTLTLQLFQEYPNAAKIITERVLPYEVQFNDQEFICQNCWRREAYPLQNRRNTASAEYSDQEIPYPIGSQPEEPYTGQDTEQPADQHAHHHTEEQLTGLLADQPVEQPADQSSHLFAEQPTITDQHALEQPADQQPHTEEQLTSQPADHPMELVVDQHAEHHPVEMLTAQPADHPMEEPAEQSGYRLLVEQLINQPADQPMVEPADQHAHHNIIIQSIDERAEQHVQHLFPPSGGHICLTCQRSVLLNRRRTLTLQLFQEYPNAARNITERVSPYEVQFNDQEFICQTCWRREAYPLRNSTITVSSDYSDQEILNPGDDHAEGQPANRPAEQPAGHPNEQPERHRATIHLSRVIRPPNTSNSCIIFSCQHRSRLRVPQHLKIKLLNEFNYYVPPSARICQEHVQLEDYNLLLSAENVSHDYNEDQITDMLDILKSVPQAITRLDFQNVENMDPNEVYFLTGRSIQQFNHILTQVPSLIRSCNQPKTALAIYLIKLRTGEPNTRLADMFHMSRRSLERLLKLARDCLYRDFVPLHLGWNHINREQVVERNLYIPNALFEGDSGEDTKAIIVCDGTYVYIQKSANFSFQRKTYSHHKYQNLLKPFLIVCCDGYIIEVTGPYTATTSDATILSNMLNSEDSEFHWFFRPGDVLILDRGFRDALPVVEACGYDAHMPLSVPRGQTQLSTVDANESRTVTICRWVVEVVNGRFKRDFKLFRQDYCNTALPHMQKDFRIAAAITNAFHEPITDSIHAHEIVDRITSRVNVNNLLAEYVIGHNLNNRRARFQSMSAELPELQDFPRLSPRDLIMFSLGTYQIKLARSYYAEHARNGIYLIEVQRDDANLHDALNNYNIAGDNFWLLRGRIQSRHTRSRIYYSYILINSDLQGLEALEHYYCSCKTGRRTLGSCSHIMSIVWFLGWARYDAISHPAAFLDSVINNTN